MLHRSVSLRDALRELTEETRVRLTAGSDEIPDATVQLPDEIKARTEWKTHFAAQNGDVWLGDTQRGVLTKVTSGSTSGNSFPVITPDGKRVIFKTRTGLFWIDAEGSGRSAQLPGTTTIDYPTSVSPDGKWLAFLRIGGGDNSGDVFLTALDGSTPPRPLVNSPAYEGGGNFSPDGRWIAYASDESDHFQVFVRPFNGPDRAG